VSKKGTRKQAVQGSKSPRPVPLWVRVCAWVGVLAALAASVALAAGRLWHHLEGRPEFALDSSSLQISYAEDCINESAMLDEVRSWLSALPTPVSLFRKDLAQRVERRLNECPWVLKVEAVQRRFPDRLFVQLEFRQPAAIVSFKGQNYLVDPEGYWLPAELYRLPEHWNVQRMPRIVDEGLLSPPAPGERWGWPRIAVGAYLTEFLRQKGLFDVLPVSIIDVSRVGSGGTEAEIVLMCSNGALVRWGTADCYALIPDLSPPPPRAVPDTEKLAKLLVKLQEYPALEGIEYIDLRFRNKISWKLRDEGETADGVR